jgi:hypothetical protein
VRIADDKLINPEQEGTQISLNKTLPDKITPSQTFISGSA